MATTPIPQTGYPDGAYLISKVYKPWPHQKEFHESASRFRLQIGSYGSGKSRPLLWEGFFHGIDVPGSDNIILRKTGPDLKRTVIDKFQTDIPEELYDYYHETDKICYHKPVRRRRIVADEERGAIWQQSTDLTSCVNVHQGRDCFGQDIPENLHCEFCSDFQIVRSTLRFGACETEKDITKFLSTEYLFVGVEELGEFPYAVWDAFEGRNRCPVPGARPNMAAATNPMGVGYGWIKKLWVDHQPATGMDPTKYDPSEYVYFHSTVDQNPIYSKDKAYLASLEKSPNAARIRWGRLDAVSGNYFDNFDLTRHVRPAEDFIFQAWQPVWIGWDYGFGHYATITFWTKAILKPGGERVKAKVVNVCLSEIYLERETPEDQTRALIAAIPRNPDTNAFLWRVESVHFSWERFIKSDRDKHGNEIAIADTVGAILIDNGLPLPTRSVTDRVAGWTKMYSLLDTDDLFLLKQDGLHRGCPMLAEAFPLVVRGDGVKVDLEDVVKPKGKSLEDDLMDSARYAVAGTLLDEGDKPAEVKLKEKLAKIEDPFRRHMEYYREHIKATRSGGDEPEPFKPSWMRKN